MKKLFTLFIAGLLTITACFGMTACSKEELKGFDIDLAKEVAKVLDVEVEFKEIDWNSKEALLENGTIDLVWNGMTITADRQAAMCVSVPYLYNKQVAVVKKADAGKYTTVESMKNAIMTAESGSAGEEVIKGEN